MHQRTGFAFLAVGALAISIAATGSGCSDECAGTSCGEPGVYVSWLPDQVPSGAMSLCVNGACRPVTPTEINRQSGTNELTAFQAHVPTSPQDAKAVDVVIEVQTSDARVARFSGAGTQSKGCCGNYAGFEVDGTALIQTDS